MGDIPIYFAVIFVFAIGGVIGSLIATRKRVNRARDRAEARKKLQAERPGERLSTCPLCQMPFPAADEYCPTCKLPLAEARRVRRRQNWKDEGRSFLE